MGEQLQGGKGGSVIGSDGENFGGVGADRWVVLPGEARAGGGEPVSRRVFISQLTQFMPPPETCKSDLEQQCHNLALPLRSLSLTPVPRIVTLKEMFETHGALD